MIDQSKMNFIDIDNKITVYDDAGFLAFKLRELADEHIGLYGRESGTPYFLKEAAVTLEGLFSAYRSLLFQEEPKRKTRLRDSDLPTLVITSLRREGYVYLDEIFALSNGELLRIKGIGAGGLDAVGTLRKEYDRVTKGES